MKHRLRFDEPARAEYLSTLKFYLVVVALAHQRREPFYWVDRLNGVKER